MPSESSDVGACGLSPPSWDIGIRAWLLARAAQSGAFVAHAHFVFGVCGLPAGDSNLCADGTIVRVRSSETEHVVVTCARIVMLVARILQQSATFLSVVEVMDFQQSTARVVACNVRPACVAGQHGFSLSVFTGAGLRGS